MKRFVEHSGATNLKVSHRGQMSLPAAARQRWALDQGGTVGALDLGDVVIIVPGGVESLRRELLDGIDESVWARVRSGFGDPDLANT